jgi:voltage-gated potassium channel
LLSFLYFFLSHVNVHSRIEIERHKHQSRQELMQSRQHIWRIVLSLFLVILFGITGYMVIGGWPFLDALYMTIITISTVGYQEVHPLSTGGRIFTSVLIVGGVGVMLYSLSVLVQYLVEWRFQDMFGRNRMKEKITELTGHIILCGYGRVGEEVARVFANERTPFVIIDRDEAATNRAVQNGYLSLPGDPTRDEILSQAGIERAKGLVVALDSDADNLYITLSAKSIRPDLHVVALGSSEESEQKLKRAGANRTILPYRIGGRHMAMLTLRPLVVDFIDTAMHSYGRELVLENVKVSADSPLAGADVKEGLSCCGALAILAVKKKDGHLIPNPPPNTKLELGDELVIIGTQEQLRAVGGSV